jgi:hypothetical protein
VLCEREGKHESEGEKETGREPNTSRARLCCVSTFAFASFSAASRTLRSAAAFSPASLACVDVYGV